MVAPLSLSLGGTLCGCAQLLCRHLRAMRIIYILYTARSSSFFLSSPLVVYIRRLKIQRRTRAAVQQFVVVALASSSLTYLGVLFFNIFLKLVGRTGGVRGYLFSFSGLLCPCFAFPLFFFLFFLSHFMIIIIISRLLSYAMALYCCCSISNDLVRSSCSLFFPRLLLFFAMTGSCQTSNTTHKKAPPPAAAAAGQFRNSAGESHFFPPFD
jgi:hypothetical protein